MKKQQEEVGKKEKPTQQAEKLSKVSILHDEENRESFSQLSDSSISVQMENQTRILKVIVTNQLSNELQSFHCWSDIFKW